MGGELPTLGKAEAAKITHLVGRVDHIKLLNQLEGNRKSASNKLQISKYFPTSWHHSSRHPITEATQSKIHHYFYINSLSFFLHCCQERIFQLTNLSI